MGRIFIVLMSFECGGWRENHDNHRVFKRDFIKRQTENLTNDR